MRGCAQVHAVNKSRHYLSAKRTTSTSTPRHPPRPSAPRLRRDDFWPPRPTRCATVTPTPPAAACSEPELPAGYPSPPPPLRAGLERAVSFVCDGRRRTATGRRAGRPYAPSNSFAPARPRRALGPQTHFRRLAIPQLFTFCSRRPSTTRRSCSPSTVAWGASSRSSNRLEPAAPPPLSVDVPSSIRGRLVPLSALCHFPDRRTSSTGDILMSKTGARDALSMLRCAACFGVDHPLNVSARPAFGRGPDDRCCARP